MKNNHTPEIRFPGFTGNWVQRKLGELAEVRTGKAFSSADFSDDGEYLVVTNKNIQDEANDIKSVGDRIDISEETILNNYLLSGDNILVTMDGVNIGKTGKYSNEKAVLAQRVGRLNSEQLEFVYQITCDNKFESEMNKLSVGNAIKHISLKQISDYSFSAPISEEEQEKIGTFFKQLDNTIVLHQQELTTLKQTKQGFLQKMIPKEGESVPEVRFPGYTGDWEERKLKDIVDLLKDGTHGTHKDGNDAFLLSAKNIKNGQIIIDELTDRKISFNDYNSIFKNYELMDQDLLITIVGTIGQTALYVETTFKLAFQRSVAIIRGNKDLNQNFLKSTVDSNYVQKQLKQSASMSAQAGVYLGDLEALTINIPKLSEQIKIGNFFKQLDDTIGLHQRELDALTETKKAFLQKMFV